jgi:hypothetical protein
VREAAGVAPGAAGNCFEKVETGFSGLAYFGLVGGLGLALEPVCGYLYTYSIGGIIFFEYREIFLYTG